MNFLPSGCRYSDFNVYPPNWNTTRASLKKTWRIVYRFYDPSQTDKYPRGKQKSLKSGLNQAHTLEDRQQIVRALIEQERTLLVDHGYNPITDKLSATESEPETEPEQTDKTANFPVDDRKISTKDYLALMDDLVPAPETPFIPALWLGLKRKKYVPQAINDIGSIIRGVEDAAKALSFENLQINQVRRRHIVLILEHCAKTRKSWSDDRFNKYKAYLSGIMKPLLQLDCMESNPMQNIDKLDVMREQRETLDKEERAKIDGYLKARDYHFWRFVQMFFHSSARETELMGVCDTDIDLVAQVVHVVIKKRRGMPVRVPRPIKDIALDLWREVITECAELRAKMPQDGPVYLFSKFLKPGYGKIRPDQVGRRWTKYVKKELGIVKDLYPLKHLNTAELMDALGQETAIEQAEKEVAEMMGHTTTTMLQQVYDQKNALRKAARAAKVKNTFA